MERRMFSWFLRMSIRWKLQLGFFVVTMITTIFNRLLATHELSKMIEIARADQVPAAVLAQMMDNPGPPHSECIADKRHKRMFAPAANLLFTIRLCPSPT
jgi:hypothetical protein